MGSWLSLLYRDRIDRWQAKGSIRRTSLEVDREGQGAGTNVAPVPFVASWWMLSRYSGWGWQEGLVDWVSFWHMPGPVPLCSMCSLNICWSTTWAFSSPPGFNPGPFLSSSQETLPFYCCAVDKELSLALDGLGCVTHIKKRELIPTNTHRAVTGLNSMWCNESQTKRKYAINRRVSLFILFRWLTSVALYFSDLSRKAQMSGG